MIDPHDMVCQEFAEVLTEYLDGALDAHDLARLEAHLAACDDCQAYLDQFKATVELTDRVDEAAVPAHLRELLRKTFRSHRIRT